MIENKQNAHPHQSGTGQAPPHSGGITAGLPPYPVGGDPVNVDGAALPGSRLGRRAEAVEPEVHLVGAESPVRLYLSLPKEYDVDEGAKYTGGEAANSSQGDIQDVGFSEKTIRRAFIRKVYGILSVQLLLTTAIIALFTFQEDVKSYVQTNFILIIIAYITAIVLLLVMGCCESTRRKSPCNLILLGLFTLTYGFVVGVTASFYEPQAVLLAAVITVAITIGLTIFAFQTKIDFTAWGGVLFCFLMVLFIFGIVMIFLPQISFLRKLFACLGALLFSFYLIYDTQLMVGGDHKCSISPEEYVFAALNIYLDIIMIFLHILRIIGEE